MALYDLDGGKKIDKMPFESEYKRYLSRMSQSEIDDIRVMLESMIQGKEIITAGWMPGNDWSGTVFEPIYERAARKSYEQSAKCFGLFVWETFMNHPENWTSGRFHKDGKEIGSRTYFRMPT